jgi:hypothetical protein
MSSNPETSNNNSSSSSIEEDIPTYPWGLEGSSFEQALENRWNAQDRQWNAHVPVPAERDLVSPFIVTSDEDSSDDEDEDPAFLPPSTPERSQPRSQKRDPSLPTSQNVMLKHPAPEPCLSHQENIGQAKESEVVRKGKEEME